MANLVFTELSFNSKFSAKSIEKKLKNVTNLCEWVLPVPSNLDDDEAYNWRIANWGTKSGAYDMIIDNGTIDFESSWSAPSPEIMQMICNKFGKSFDHINVGCDDDVFVKTYNPIKD